MKNFRSFKTAVEFYRLTRTLKLTAALKDQLERAASSVALNLAEGSGKSTRKDQVRFFHIAMGSIRESQAILILATKENSDAWHVLDKLGAQVYRLICYARG